jgi:UDP-N-acetylglucosamine:LPS N-acetylglucosamine transferase
MEVVEGRIRIFPHLDSSQIKYCIENSEYIVCRSGYSTLMDLACLGKPAILIPTPGQTEQEYLAKRLSEKKIHYSVDQDEFRLEDALQKFSGYSGITLRNDLKELQDRIRRLSVL